MPAHSASEAWAQCQRRKALHGKAFPAFQNAVVVEVEVPA
jgi:hypothetical protein